MISDKNPFIFVPLFRELLQGTAKTPNRNIKVIFSQISSFKIQLLMHCVSTVRFTLRFEYFEFEINMLNRMMHELRLKIIGFQ